MWYMCFVVPYVCGQRTGSGQQNSVIQSTVPPDHGLQPQGVVGQASPRWGADNPNGGSLVCVGECFLLTSEEQDDE